MPSVKPILVRFSEGWEDEARMKIDYESENMVWESGGEGEAEG